jgi:uncharacterized protein
MVGVLVVAGVLGLFAGHLRAAASGPAAVQSNVPTGEFVWHDMITNDAAAARTFYGSLFGWTFQPGQGVEPGYTVIKQDGYPIGGIVTAKDAGTVPQWLSYVAVADVDRASAAFSEAGGRVYRSPLDARKNLRVAVVGDAQGAPLGLASRGPDVPAGSVPAINRWLWMEYLAVDAAPALDFYSKVIGYTSEISETRAGQSYHLLKTDRACAGLFTSPWKRETAVWLPYVRVEDAAAAAKRVTELGGTVLLEPKPDIRNGSLAVVLDPSGAPLALQKFPFDTKARH